MEREAVPDDIFDAIRTLIGDINRTQSRIQGEVGDQMELLEALQDDVLKSQRRLEFLTNKIEMKLAGR